MPNRKISDLPVLPASQDLSNVLIGLDNTNNNVSYQISIDALGDELNLDEIANHQLIFGVPAGSTHLGTWTGPILTNNANLKTNIQELSDAIESEQSDPGTTNLDYLQRSGDGEVTSDTGDNAILPLADGSFAGLMPPGDKQKMDWIAITQDVDLDQIEINADEVPNHQLLFGVVAGSTQLGPFTGSILTTSNVMVNLQSLSDAVENLQTVNPFPTDLGYNNHPDKGEVTSSTGLAATLPAVTSVNAGLALPDHKRKLDLITIVAPHNIDELRNLIDANTLEHSNKSTLIGMPAGSLNMGFFSGNVLTDNTTIKANLQELSNAIENNLAGTDLTWQVTGDVGTMISSNGDNAQILIATEVDAGLMDIEAKRKSNLITVNNPRDLDAMHQDIDDHQAVLGIPDGQRDMGDFLGTLLPGNEDIKDLLQILADAIEAGPTDVPEVLSDLDDVNTAGVDDGDFLAFNLGTGTWLPVPNPGAGTGNTDLAWVPANKQITSSTGLPATLTDVSLSFAGLATPQMLADITNLQSLGGVGGNPHLGAFPGSIITDNVNIYTALSELENAIENIGTGLENVVEDPSPQLGGPLETLDQDIVITDGSENERGRIGRLSTDDGIFIARTDDGTFDTADGGIALQPGNVTLYGTAPNIDALDFGDGQIRQVWATGDGQLFGIVGEVGWEKPDTDNGTYSLGTGIGQGAWVQLTGLMVDITAPAQPVADGDRLNVIANLYATNVTTDRNGTIEVGFGINGAQPTFGQVVSVPANFSGLVPAALSTQGHGGLSANDQIHVWARRASGDHASFGVDLIGTTTNHELIVSVPSSGGGGGPGEVNFLSNVGTGMSLDGGKVSEALQIKSLTSTGGTVTLTQTATEVNFEVDTSGLVDSSTTITAGVGLTGGGDLTASRTIDLELNELGTGAIADGNRFSYTTGAGVNLVVAWGTMKTDLVINTNVNSGLAGGQNLATNADLQLDVDNLPTEASINGTDLIPFYSQSNGDTRNISWNDFTNGLGGGGGVPDTRVVGTEAPLKDGGDLTQNRTHKFDIGLLTNESGIVDADEFIFRDVNQAGEGNRRITFAQLKAAIPSATSKDFTTENLTRAPGAGGLTHQWNDNNLTITGSATHSYTAGTLNLDATSGAVTIDSNTAAQIITDGVEVKGKTSSVSGALRLYESTDDGGVSFVSLHAPDLSASYGIVLPDAQPAADNQVLTVAAGTGGTNAPVLEWTNFPTDTDTNFGNASFAFTGPQVHTTSTNNWTVSGTSTYRFSTNTIELDGASSVNVQAPALHVRNSNLDAGGVLRIHEGENTGTDYVAFTVPDVMSTFYTMELPGTPGADGQALTIQSGGGTSNLVLDWSDAGGGDVTGGTNVGTGEGNVFAETAAGVMEFRRLQAGSGATITQSGDSIIITATGTGGGEANRGENVGLGTGNIYANMNSDNLRFRTLRSTDLGALTIQDNADTIDFTVTALSSATNVGVGVAGVWRDTTSGQLNFRSFLSGDSSISITENTNEIDIRSNVVDTNFAHDSLTRNAGQGAVTHNFNDNNLTINSTGNQTYSGGNADLVATNQARVAGATSALIGSPIINLVNEGAGTASLRFREDGTDYVAFKAPTNVPLSYECTLPADPPTDNQVLTATTGGANTVLSWESGGGAGGGRKEGADDDGSVSGGTHTFNFDAGSFDNKVLQLDNGTDTTITLQATRGGRYSVYIRSISDGTRQPITWDPGTHSWSSTALGNLPKWVESNESLKIELEYDSVLDQWFADPVAEEEYVIDATTIGATFQPDHGGGVARRQRITGEFSQATTIDIPLNMSVGEVMFISFESAQSTPPTISANPELTKLSDEPDWSQPNVLIAIHRTGRTTGSYYFTFANERA